MSAGYPDGVTGAMIDALVGSPRRASSIDVPGDERTPTGDGAWASNFAKPKTFAEAKADHAAACKAQEHHAPMFAGFLRAWADSLPDYGRARAIELLAEYDSYRDRERAAIAAMNAAIAAKVQ